MDDLVTVSNSNVMGRPRLELSEADWGNLEKLCSILCTQEECASFLDVSVDTLSRRIQERFGMTFAEYFKKHSNAGLISLRRLQWKSAMDGNVTMQIWLGKQCLGQKSNVNMSITNGMSPLQVAWRRLDEGTL